MAKQLQPFREIEMKFIPKQTIEKDELKRFLDEQKIQIQSTKTEHNKDEYFDTQDWWFYRAGTAFRVRERGKKGMVTLKSLNPSKKGMAIRHEIQAAYYPQRSETPLPEGPLRPWIQNHCGQHEYVSLFTLFTKRELFQLNSHDGSAWELCVDDVLYPSNGSQTQFLEVELELKQGPIEEFIKFAKQLSDTFHLKQNNASKFDLGIRYANLHPPKTKPEKHHPEKGDSVFHALQQIVAFNLDAMLYHEPGARLGIDPKHIHQMRVAVRRMRAAFSTFGDYIPEEDANTLKPRLVDIFQTLGRVRDIDVQLIMLQDEADRYPEKAGEIQQAIQWLQTKREANHQTVIDMFVSELYRNSVQRIRTFAERDVSGNNLPKQCKKPLNKIAPSLVREYWLKVWNKGEAITIDSDEEKFHRLRISCKKMRYLCGFLKYAYGKPVKKLSKHMKSVQETLGLRQDAIVAQQMLNPFIVEQANSDAAAVVQNILQRQEEKALQKQNEFFSLWKNIRKIKAKDINL